MFKIGGREKSDAHPHCIHSAKVIFLRNSKLEGILRASVGGYAFFGIDRLFPIDSTYLQSTFQISSCVFRSFELF